MKTPCILVSLTVLAATTADAASKPLKGTRGRNELVLWYNQLAADWNEALPIGNGNMGAMVFGGVPQERLQLNESTIWTGKPRSYAHPGAVKYLSQIRELLQEMRRCERAGDLKKAREWQLKAEELAMKEFLSIPLHEASYQPMGELYIDFPDHTQVDGYRRELDLKNGLATVSYENQGVRYTRETFASHPDKCIVTRISADKPEAVSCTIRLEGPEFGKNDAPITWQIKSVTDSGIVLSGQVVEGTDKSEKDVNDGAIRYEAHLQVSTTGGQMTREGEGLAVHGATDVTIRLVAASNFTDYKTLGADPAERCLAMLNPITAKTFDQIYQAHLDDYRPLFNRVSLALGDPKASRLPTDQRVKNFVQTQDYDLVALIFQYGRYLAISGSREGGLPLNLLGIWTLRPAWGSKYTCNINIEMNYWPMNPTGIPECNMPLFETLEDLAESGSITAREHYGAGGWVLHHNWDLWCGTAPINKSNHGIWVTGSGWMALHVWEHFLFTGDLEILKEYYPVLKGAAQFYTDFLYEDEITGYLISGPSNSPEHGGLVMGPTMDHQIIRSLFKAFVLASRLVGDDSELAPKAEAMIARIAPNRKGQYGQLQEWLEDKDSTKDTHRHLSHLWAVFPGCDINWQDQEMFDAARQSLIFRGDGQTGWSLAWKLNLWARLLDGDHALKILNNHIVPGRDKPNKSAGFYPNLLNANPPFVIDGNFGVCSGVVEMLLQSHILGDVPKEGPLEYSDFEFLIHLLPALPSTWKGGSFEGFRARGGFEVSASWEKGKLTTVVIKSLTGNPCQLKYGEKVIDLRLDKGEVTTIFF